MEQDNCHPQPGDLIDIYRPGYQHWALYVGDGYVIHVTDEGAQSVLGSSSSVSATRAKVKKQLQREVAGNDTWCVNKYDRSHAPHPVDMIIRSAEQWVDTEVPVNVLSSNCEHFVPMLHYGVRISGQVTNAVVGSTAAAAVGFLVAFALLL